LISSDFTDCLGDGLVDLLNDLMHVQMKLYMRCWLVIVSGWREAVFALNLMWMLLWID